MIAISFYYGGNDEFKMELFHTEEEAKLWFIDELFINKVLWYWIDIVDGKEINYTKEDDIRSCLLQLNLSEIVEGLKFDNIRILIKKN